MAVIDTSQFRGIFAAAICPMHADFRIDEAAFRRHVGGLAAVPGIRGFLINGHAGENMALARAEKRRIVEMAREAAPDGCLLVAGVNAESSLDAAEQARDAEAAGADAIMVFPPNAWALPVAPQTIVTHHRYVLDATSLPIFLYLAPVSTGPMAYDAEVISRLVRLPRIAGIKEGSWETARYETNRRLVKAIAPHVRVMASGDEHLLTTFVLGSEGSLVSLAVIVPEVIVELEEAVRRNDLAAARAQHEIIYPLARAIYGTPPGAHAAARLKTCLKLLGRLDCDAVRPPIGPLPDSEVAMLRQALAEAELLPAQAARSHA